MKFSILFRHCAFPEAQLASEARTASNAAIHAPFATGEGSTLPACHYRFLALTRAFPGATNRRKTSSLVVSLLSNCEEQYASEAAALPGRAGC